MTTQVQCNVNGSLELLLLSLLLLFFSRSEFLFESSRQHRRRAEGAQSGANLGQFFLKYIYSYLFIIIYLDGCTELGSDWLVSWLLGKKTMARRVSSLRFSD